MDLRDIFGDRPERPDHPDFWKISEILLEMDAEINTSRMTQDECEVEFVKRLQRIGVDQASLSYAAAQRTLRAIHSLPATFPQQARIVLATLMGGIWVDGFTAGAAYAERRQDA
jgi:hypothetical protein